ncbi:MAG: hypothetical protein KDL87_13855 [Verrucomicrobiae bacterium]|nr:hypothetical protein [Verrucomicrobiae bacterium]
MTHAESSPSDPPPPPRWWRNRRRQFQVAVIAVPLALLLGGGAWWYAADFPMPFQKTRTFAGISLEPLSHWLWEGQLKLRFWKSGHITRRMTLNGTVWKERGSNGELTLTFGIDGRLSEKFDPGYVLPSSKTLVSNPFSSRGIPLPYAEVAEFYRQLDGMPHQFLRDTRWPSQIDWAMQRCEPNLQLGTTGWSGFLQCDPANPDLISLYFTFPGGQTRHLVLERVPPVAP